MQLKTITELLALPNYKVAGIAPSDNPEHLCFSLEQIKITPPICSGCGKVHHNSVHSKTIVVVEDMRISGKRIFLHVPKRKSFCTADGRIRVEEIAWLRGRFTRRFAEQIHRLTAITTNKEAGWFLELDDETVYRIDRSMLEELARKKLVPIPPPFFKLVVT